jgi:hypothetical protein
MFTFQPRSVRQLNRSRIDFFLISDSIINFCQDCRVADSLQSSLFDHKAVLINFRKKNTNLRCYNSNFVSNKVIKDPDSSLLVDIATKECFLIYQDLDRVEKERLLTILGTSRQLLRDAGPCYTHYNLSSNDDIIQANRDQLLNLVNNNLSRQDIQLIPNLQINIDYDLFFEVLINHVRNELVSYQAFLKKFTSKGKRDLINRLVELRKNFNVNFQAIQEVELQLQQISEAEIENILETNPIFDQINNKKMSPLFLKLAKSNTGGSSLSQVRNENDELFRTGHDRDELCKRVFLLR